MTENLCKVPCSYYARALITLTPILKANGTQPVRPTADFSSSFEAAITERRVAVGLVKIAIVLTGVGQF